MSKQIESFQDNIRRTFILFSLTPVIAIVFTAIILFIFTWSAYMAQTTSDDSRIIAQEADEVLSTYYGMITDVEFVVSTAELDISKASDKVFSILYNRTSDYDDIGNLIIMSPERKALRRRYRSRPGPHILLPAFYTAQKHSEETQDHG